MRQPAADELTRALSSDERARASEFRFDDPRRRFVIARGALRRLLGEYLALEPEKVKLTLDDNQKPRLADSHAASGLHFNVSHSGDVALIAVTIGCEIGVDVEQMRDVGHLEQIARRFFHPAETEAVLATPAAERTNAFLRCWTGKEAILKAFGTGITGSLADFQVPTHEAPPGWIECDQSRCWLQQLTPCNGYIGAVSCIRSKRAVRAWTFEP
jgi:4'-phosphopantetheinyl transferase